MDFDKILDKGVDSVFNMGRHKVYLLGILVLGFVLRLIAAINLSVSADDMHFVTHAINFLSADKIVTYDQSSGLWFAFTSISYKIFGLTQLGSRMAALIFGSLSIIAIYLLTREFFGKRESLIAALLLAIAPFHIKNTIAEMDVMAMFFVLMAMLFFMKAMKSEKDWLYALSGIFLGLAIYTKVYPLLFIPSLLIYFVYVKWKNEEEIFSKDNLKKIAIFLLLIFVFTIPALTHNYLLYQDKGFLDLQFTRTLGLGKNVSEQYYGWDAQFNAKNSWKGLIFGDTRHSGSGNPLLWVAINFIRQGDPLAFYLGIIGIFFILFKRKDYRNYLVFSLLGILFILPFLASIILLPKHFIFLELLLVPLGALSVKEINRSLSKKLGKDCLKIVLVVLFLFSLIYLGLPPKADIYHFYGKSHIGQMIDFKNSKISENSLIVADSRIYRGRINWALQERPYLEAGDFADIISKSESLPGPIVNTEVYFVECAIDDCGWGTIGNQPGLNESMESLVKFFEKNGQVVKTISEPIEKKPYYPFISSGNKEEIIRIHKVVMPIKSVIVLAASEPKSWFLYNIGYLPTGKEFDSFEVSGVLNKSLYQIALWIVKLSLFLSLVSVIYVLYLWFKK